MAVSISQPKRVRESADFLAGESPKKGSTYYYDRIQAWINKNKTEKEILYLSSRVRRAGLSLTEATWVYKMLTTLHSGKMEISALLSMPAHIRRAVQAYHYIARREGMSLRSCREPSELTVPKPKTTSSIVSAVLDIAREQFCIIFDVEEPTREVNTCVELLKRLFTWVPNEQEKDLSNQFVLCLLLSIRNDNSNIFHEAHTVEVRIWDLLVEIFRAEEKTLMR